MGETNNTKEFRKLKKMLIIAVILYLASAILGIGNSFTGDEIVEIQEILIHEEICRTIEDENWKKISELHMAIEKHTLLDGTIVISNWWKGKLVFENVDIDSMTVGNPIIYKPNILERLLSNVIYLFVFIAIGLFFIALETWSGAIVAELSTLDDLDDDEEYDDDDDETLLENEKENSDPSEEKFEEVPKER